ncbi:MAG: Ig-like domain-containing protein [Myxococcota bacterium]
MRSSSLRSSCLVTLAATAFVAPAVAMANGNVSHQWVSRTAIESTPSEGSLADLVGDPDLQPLIDGGTMFPDWGYTPGATSEERDAGEASHWEPVQDAYRQWILANYAPPWSDEARQHLAFYFGMTSHGMADQSYDAMFFERSRFYQGGDHGEFDQDSDVLWAATTGPAAVPETWTPASPLLELFQALVGVTIDERSMTQQLGFVAVAIGAVNVLAEDPAQVASAEADFPWAAEHDDDPLTPGNPPHEAEIVRRYWRSNWALFHGDEVPRPVLWTHPADGGSGHGTDPASIESWISIVFARGLFSPELDASRFHVVDSSGAEVPITIDLFYGNESHVLHVRPEEALLADEVYVVTVDAGIETIHGELLEGWDFAFSTGDRAPDPLHDDGFWDEPDPYGDEDPGTGGSDDAGVTGTDTGEGLDDSATGNGGGTTVDPTTATEGVRARGATSSCACTHGEGFGRRDVGGLALFGLMLLGWARRRP